MKVLIVYAHPEPRSFNGAMKDAAVSTLQRMGHEVRVSDLYAEGFEPAAGPEDFLSTDPELPFQLQREQASACQTGLFAPALKAEIEKLAWCELLILQFPLWWFSIPAILKGWVDRVFAYGFAYGRGQSLLGKLAMVSVTTGGPAGFFTPEGRGTIDHNLDHLLRGTLEFCGMRLLPSFVAYGAGRATPEQNARRLKQYERHLAQVMAEAAVSPGSKWFVKGA